MSDNHVLCFYFIIILLSPVLKIFILGLTIACCYFSIKSGSALLSITSFGPVLLYPLHLYVRMKLLTHFMIHSKYTIVHPIHLMNKTLVWFHETCHFQSRPSRPHRQSTPWSYFANFACTYFTTDFYFAPLHPYIFIGIYFHYFVSLITYITK